MSVSQSRDSTIKSARSVRATGVVCEIGERVEIVNFFIYGLFNDAARYSDYIPLNNIVTCYLRGQPNRGSFLGNNFVNTQQYWSRC
jgi:hypothetical protein